jgi:hypothetical protein
LWLKKKVGQQIYPSLLLLFLDPGSGMDKNQDGLTSWIRNTDYKFPFKVHDQIEPATTKGSPAMTKI